MAPKGPTAGRTPRRRCRAVRAIRTGPDDQAPTSRTTARIGEPGRLLLSSAMAKAKRRKILARRKKANHGRRPNAGRG